MSHLYLQLENTLFFEVELYVNVVAPYVTERFTVNAGELEHLTVDGKIYCGFDD